MSESGNDKNISKGKGKKKYELSTIDLRFLRVVDEVIKKNKIEGINPKSDSTISKIIFGDRYAVSKIRSSHRGVTLAQVEKTAIYFNLDSNCFFRDTTKIEYDPSSIGDKVVVKDNAQIHSGSGNINTANGDNNHFGDNNYHGDIGKQFDEFKKIVDKVECPPEIQNKFDLISKQIQNKSTHLESMLDEKTESLKKMADLLIIEAASRERAELSCDKAREDEQKMKDKYISLLDKYTSLLEEKK